MSEAEQHRRMPRGGSKDTNNPSPSSPPDREPKRSGSVGQREVGLNDFFWDDVVYYGSSAMVVLTLLDLLATFLGDAVHCYAPAAGAGSPAGRPNLTFSQEQFLNSYCAQFTRPADFFPFYLVVQVTFIYGVHFLWYSWFQGKFRYFVSLATSLARHRDGLAGKYPLGNFVTLRALLSAYGGSRSVFLLYVAKSLVQLFAASASVYLTFDPLVFGDFNATYDCPQAALRARMADWPLARGEGEAGEGGVVTCVLTSLVVLRAVQWLNLILLGGILAMVAWGLLWMLASHGSRLNWLPVARFCLESGLPPAEYVPKPRRLRYLHRRYLLRYESAVAHVCVFGMKIRCKQ